MKHWFEDFKFCSTVLTGDLPESTRLRDAIELGEGQRLCVYQIPHHGARQEESAQITDSEYSVVSYGLHNRYGHPKWDTLKQYIDNSRIVSVNEDMNCTYGTKDGSSMHFYGDFSRRFISI